jgi:hypothetical protein
MRFDRQGRAIEAVEDRGPREFRHGVQRQRFAAEQFEQPGQTDDTARNLLFGDRKSAV